MDEMVRVKLENGAEATLTRALADEHKLEILDKPATDARGYALSEKPKVELSPSNPDAAPYLGMKAEELQAEADRRQLDVEGTGKDGKALKPDLVAALVAHDTATGANAGAS